MSASKNYDLGLLILRVGLAALMLTHGIPKLIEIINGDFAFANPLGIGAGLSKILAMSAEFLCSVLIILGIRTRLASIPIIITMLVALFLVHWDDPIGSKEKAMLYIIGFLTIAIIGGGKHTIKKLF